MKITLQDYQASRANNKELLKKLLIIDFDDSFTYNIVADFLSIGVGISVINHRDFEKFYRGKKEFIVDQFDGVLLGPGPGKPLDYAKLFGTFQEMKSEKDLKLFGICLGHQILLELHGHKCQKSANILHGTSETLNFSPWIKLFPSFLNKKNIILKVQRYNSLCIKSNSLLSHKDNFSILNHSNEVMAFYCDEFISFQFHPESIGTSSSLLFFNLILESLKSK